MSFLHPEFFGWLLAPTVILFYFWLTQKPLQNRWLSEEVLAKLRAPETTMGLKGRNGLFLVAALLLIVAMAQPVILDTIPIKEKKLHILLAIDREEANFEQTRSLALSTLYTLLGEEIELLAFDERVYHIAPRSNDGVILGELIQHLSSSIKSANKNLLEEKLLQSDADMKIVVSSNTFESPRFLLVTSSTDIVNVHEKLIELRKHHHLQAHIPLFFYPLGLAMLLILLALSSMSKRQSVSIGIILCTLSFFPAPSDAGLLDFQLLRDAKAAYESGKYKKSEQLYAQYQLQHDSPQVRYNRANALYMSGNYERARVWYERVYTNDPILAQRTSHNLQQSVAKIKTAQAHQKSDEKGVSTIKEPMPIAPLRRKEVKRETRLFAW
jgi:tetratricopeptide (TPR) repeat protein